MLGHVTVKKNGAAQSHILLPFTSPGDEAASNLRFSLDLARQAEVRILKNVFSDLHAFFSLPHTLRRSYISNEITSAFDEISDGLMAKKSTPVHRNRSFPKGVPLTIIRKSLNFQISYFLTSLGGQIFQVSPEDIPEVAQRISGVCRSYLSFA